MRRQSIVRQGYHSTNNAIVTSTPAAPKTSPRRTRGIAPPVFVTDAGSVPIVAEGTAPLTPFSAIASSDNAAKPIDAGLYRNTEYTFFCAQHSAVSRSARTTTGTKTDQERVPNDPRRGRARAAHRRGRTQLEKGTDAFARADGRVGKVGCAHRPVVAAKRDLDRD